MIRRATTFAFVLGVLLAPSVVPAATSKLDPRARFAAAQLQAGARPSDLRANSLSVTDEAQLDVFITGAITREELEAMGVTVRTALPGVFTAYVPAAVVDQLAAHSRVSSVRGAAVCQQYLDVSVPTTGANLLRGAGPVFAGLNGAGVLVGDVDSGIDFKHDDFKDTGGLSRILYLWDQNNTTSVVPPAGYSYGHEWTKASIDGGTCTELDGGTLASGGGHGTHVMGIAAGDGSAGSTPFMYAGMAPMADIAMVATTFYDTAILDGVNYIMGRATATGKNCVVNLSLGSQYGPHDGSSPFEAGLDALSGPGRVVCVAAGNDASTSTFLHGGMDVPAGGDSMKFTIGGGTTSGRAVEFNGWYNAPDNMVVKLRSPGNLIITLNPGQTYGTLSGTTGFPTNNTGVNGRVYMENAVFTSSNGAREIYLIMQASGTGTGGITGVWTVYCTPTSMSGPTSRVDMWKDYVSTTALTANFSLKQSNDHITAEPSNARRVITVAAWETKNSWVSCNAGNTYTYSGPAPIGAIATFSSIGPSRDGFQKPDIAAPGMGIGAARSADASGTCAAFVYQLNDGGVHMINQGTSMAAPHVTGATALLFQKFGAWTPEQVKSYLFSHATIDANTGAPWNTTWGNGKLHLGDLIDPTVAVTSPNGGETVTIGTSANLQWSATDNVGVTSVDVHLSRSGPGGPWETIALGIPNSGSTPWFVTGPPTTNAYLRVTGRDAEGNTKADLSNSQWTIFDVATGTALANLIASSTDAGIEVRWSLGRSADYSSVAVARATSSTGPWTDMDLARHDDGGQVVMLDESVEAGRTYWYRLVGTTVSGSQVTLGQVSGTAGQSLTSFALSRVAPNPTRDFTQVEFTVPRTANVQVSVVDVLGREVAQLASGSHNPGRYTVTWNGELNGRRAPSGLYFIRLRAPGVNMTRRVALTR